MQAALLALCAAAGLITGGPVLAQAPLAQRALAASEDGPPPFLTGRVALEPRQLAQLVATRNAEIRYSRLGVDVASQLTRAEAALYETVFFGALKGEDRERQRTAEERISSASGLSILEETTATAEAGLRQRLPTAGEIAVSYRLFRRSNNIIAAANSNRRDTEYNGAVVISVKQPLLRNRGRDVLETDRRIAEIEEQVQWMTFRQQVLKSTSEALSLYWQLHRAQEARQLRDESLQNVRRMAGDVAARIEAGRAPPASRLEVQSTVVAREAEVTRAEVAAREAEAKVMSALSLSAAVHPGLRFQASGGVLLPPGQPEGTQQALDRALANWPPYQLALLRAQQARLRLAFADNQRQPALDVSASWSSTGLAYRRHRAEVLVKAERYPEWTVGVNLEMPLAGNGRADGQYQAQALRVQQGELELDAIRSTVANDLAQRHEELVATLQMVEQMREDLRLRQVLLDNERERYTMGLGQLRQWLERENEVVEARQRLAEAVMRAQLAQVAWQYAQGILLDEYDIALRYE